MTAEAMPVVIDLGAILSTLRRRVLTIVSGVIAGALAAIAILYFVPPRFDGRALVLVRTSANDPTALVKGRMGPIADLLPAASALGGGDQEIATELALLQSRAVLGSVVDSLRLMVTPKNPARVPATSIVDSIRFVSRFKPIEVELKPGANRVGTGTIWAKQAATVKLLDREDAIDDLVDRLTVRKSGGEAIGIAYRAPDSLSAERVPNLIAEVYFARRRTVDRGLNQRRLEFLTAKADSVRVDLRRSADNLASVAQQSGTGTTPEIAGKALADEMGTLQARLAEIRAGEYALDTLTDGVRAKRYDPRLLAGVPELLKSPALNDLISQIARVETERTVLLGRVPVTAPQAVALAHARDSLLSQLLPIALSYRSSLGRQRQSVEHDLGVLNAQIGKLPAQAAAIAKEQAEVTRLAALNAGMGAQVLEARLAALVEGGDVRLIDPAVAPRRVSFPRPLATIAICLAVGMVAGLAIALFGVPITATTARQD